MLGARALGTIRARRYHPLEMSLLKLRTIWEERVGPDSEKNMLIVQIAETQTTNYSEPPTNTCKVEIIPPLEDEFGRPCEERWKIETDSVVVSRLRDAITAINHAQFEPRPNKNTVQLRYEVTDKLVVICEVLPFTKPREMKMRFIIGNGEDVRFTVESFNDLDNLCRHLEDAV